MGIVPVDVIDQTALSSRNDRSFFALALERCCLSIAVDCEVWKGYK